MADRDAIRNRAIRRRTEKLQNTVTWPDVVAAFQAATPEARQSFAASIYGRPDSETVRILKAIVRAKVEADATTEVDAAMADDAFTLDELETLFL